MWLIERVAAAPRWRAVAAGVALSVAAPLAAPPAALSASVSSQERFNQGGPYQKIVFEAVPGEANRLAATLSQMMLNLSDPVGITPLAGCERPTPTDATAVVCRALGGIVFEATLADGDDVLSANLALVAHGGSGKDVLRGSGSLYGESGADTIVGEGDEDVLKGGSGRDRLAGGGHGHLSGGSGADIVNGRRGDDLLRGGPGGDLLDGGRGFDIFDGGGGRDRLHARDRHPDIVECRGADRATLDRLDMLRGRCARVARTGAARAVPVGDLSSDPLTLGVTTEADSLGTGVGCPADRATACTGSLVIRDAGRVLGRKRFGPLGPGQERQLTMHVGERVVNRAGSGDSRVRLVVTTRDPARILQAVAAAEVF